MCPDHKIIKRQNPCTFPSGHAAFQQKKKNYKWRTLRQLFRGRVGFNEQKYQEQNQSRGSVIPGKVKDLEKSKKVEKSSACSGNDNKFMWLQYRLQSQMFDPAGSIVVLWQDHCHIYRPYSGSIGRSIVVPMAPVLEPKYTWFESWIYHFKVMLPSQVT